MVSCFTIVAICFIWAVGRESVLALAANRELRCGRRLVTGLFTRPRLPLGYSHVATVPRGACRLNFSEILPSDNYIALKMTNGSYVINGEFAISTPGTYDAVGARFIYSRVRGLDSIFTLGPIHHPIDIMVLYTVPNPNIKYEYLTDSLPGDINTEEPTTKLSSIDTQGTVTAKHTRRHHGYDSYPKFIVDNMHPDVVGLSKENTIAKKGIDENIVGTRRFVWKILSYTHCTRTCGGGIQVGKYRCVEETTDGVDREISPVHCSGSAPSGKRRRCGMISCPPRWRAAAWSPCPTCGPANRTRIVGCVQDHSRGITKVNDDKCSLEKPVTSEKCNVPDCPKYSTLESKHVIRLNEDTDTFREGPVYTISVNNSETDLGPEYRLSASAGWLSSDWSQCVGWCVGGGLQTRSVRCSDPSGCSPQISPDVRRNCTAKVTCVPHEGHWFTGEWSSCSAPCGGKQIRGVLCIGETGRHLRDSACKDPKPANERDCGECAPVWYYSEWSKCVGNCSLKTGVQHRSVVCARGRNGANEGECTAPRPPAHRPCDPICPTDNTAAAVLTSPSHRVDKYTTTTTSSTTQTSTIDGNDDKDCIDRLSNCALAVQARLCHYMYYIRNCCNSCINIIDIH
ncbi:ADAMTS-like protein 4 [Papilio machaon]|uniref:ADAMTS-like protein 4 n=1 Tax=Papilio machaon TaxID=76193 RepID=UPI001E662D16|nr:ADAMTS-like protein 4 [Papilio machaon]